MSILQGAIIGFGKIARNAHMPAYAAGRITSMARIVAAVEPEEAGRAAAAAAYPSLRFYAAADDLFANEQLDFIDICAPPLFHPDLIRAGSERGVAILCEKPFAVSLGAATAAAEALTQSNVAFMPCHQYRYSPVWGHFRQFLEEEGPEAGWFLQFNVLRTQADSGSAWNPSWRTDRELSGGGILADTGVHYLYVASWLLGNPQAVTAITRRLHHRLNGVEDSGFVLLDFPGGVAEINLTWAADRRANYARLAGHRGSIVYDGRTILRYRGHRRDEFTVPDASDKTTYISLYVDLFTEFFRSVAEGSGRAVRVEEALQSVRLLESCYLSARDHHTVTLPAAACPETSA